MASDSGGMASDRDGQSLADRLPAGLVDAVALFLTLRVAIGLIAIYAWWRGGLPGPCHFEIARDGWATIPPLADQGAAFPLVGVWQRWDGCWYSKIAAFGYEPNEVSINFFPLFPVLTGWAARLVDGSVALGGLIVNAIAYVVAMTGLYRLVARDIDPTVARRAVLLLSIFPSAFFLFAPFTEATFLAVSIWCIAMARERRWLLAGALGLLAGTARVQGIFLLLPVGWEALVASGITAWRPWRDARMPSIATRPLIAGSLASVTPLLGFAGFIGYGAMAIGRTPLDTQALWGGSTFFPPWEVAAAAWTWAFDHQDPLQLVNLGLLALFGVLLIAGLRRIPLAYSLFALPQVVLLATRIQPTPLTSTSRLLLVVFPAFVVLAAIPWPRARLAWAITSTLFLGVFVQAFVMGDFVA